MSYPWFLSTTGLLSGAVAPTGYPMNSCDPFQQLRDLDGTSPQFHKQLTSFFCGNVYQDALPRLHSKDLAWLIEYLNNVRLQVILPPRCAQLRRITIRFSSTLPTMRHPCSRNPYTDSRRFVAQKKCFRDRAYFQGLSWDTCTKGPSKVQKCGSDASGRTPD